jgi:hypothetical protein
MSTDYSRDIIEAVFSTEEKAHTYIKEKRKNILGNFYYKEFVIDDIEVNPIKNKRYYRVIIKKNKYEVEKAELIKWEDEMYYWENEYEITVFAKSEDGAKQKAFKQRDKYIKEFNFKKELERCEKSLSFYKDKSNAYFCYCTNDKDAERDRQEKINVLKNRIELCKKSLKEGK